MTTTDSGPRLRHRGPRSEHVRSRRALAWASPSPPGAVHLFEAPHSHKPAPLTAEPDGATADSGPRLRRRGSFFRGSMKLSDFVSQSSAAPGGFQPECAAPVRRERMRRTKTQHDALKWRIFEDTKDMGARCRVEVCGLFAACMPQDGRALAADMPPRKRQGLVPDFLYNLLLDEPEKQILFELKTLHYGSTTYPTSRERCEAVARRARTLPREYADKARTLDRKCCRTPAGSTGPVKNKLRSYDPMRGLVFGAWGEGSPEVDRLIGMLAHIGSRRHWRSMQARSADEAQQVLAWMLRRRWALTALRENARLKLERLEFVGRGAAAAAARRLNAAVGNEARARRVACASHRGLRAVLHC